MACPQSSKICWADKSTALDDAILVKSPACNSRIFPIASSACTSDADFLLTNRMGAGCSFFRIGLRECRECSTARLPSILPLPILGDRKGERGRERGGCGECSRRACTLVSALASRVVRVVELANCGSLFALQQLVPQCISFAVMSIPQDADGCFVCSLLVSDVDHNIRGFPDKILTLCESRSRRKQSFRLLSPRLSCSIVAHSATRIHRTNPCSWARHQNIVHGSDSSTLSLCQSCECIFWPRAGSLSSEWGRWKVGQYLVLNSCTTGPQEPGPQYQQQVPVCHTVPKKRIPAWYR